MEEEDKEVDIIGLYVYLTKLVEAGFPNATCEISITRYGKP
jgi:hypothetical protein